MRRVNLDDFKSEKVALVMSGGVVKAAAWHIGVGLALEELGFTLKNNKTEKSNLEISTYVGSSAGALISLYYANGIKPIDIIHSHTDKIESPIKPVTYKDMLSFKKFIRNPPRGQNYDPFSEFPSIIKRLISPLMNFSGIFTTSGLKSYLEREILESNNFNDYAADVFIIATQLDHSRKVIFSK